MSIWAEVDPFRNGRRYAVSLVAKNPKTASSLDVWWPLVGAYHSCDRNLSQILNLLKKAQNGEYQGILLHEPSLRHPQIEEVLQVCVKRGFKIYLQVSLAFFINQNLSSFEKYSVVWDVVCDQIPESWSLLKKMAAAQRLILTIPGLRGLAIWQDWALVPEEFYPLCEFYFPYRLGWRQKWSPKQIVAWLKRHPRIAPHFKPSQGIDIFESRIDFSRDLEPQHPPIWQNQISLKPKISVVIPTFNNGLYLINTLKHLEHQHLQKEFYEVIIVDDGSTDMTSEQLLTVLKNSKMCLTLLYYPRQEPRQMGDAHFRAGLARNYGVRWARGPLLVFLDADIITPPDFLETTERLHHEHTVVQWRRDYLTAQVPSFEIQHKDVKPEKDCFIPERGYWHQFYERAQNQGWSSVEDGWKYVCTYALSMPTEVFKKVGWFRKTFCYYGLEDTDLGWRLKNAGCTFYLNNPPVYHLHHSALRSEFFNSGYRRQKLLKKTAEIFFYNNLSPKIYHVFKSLLNSWFF